MCNVRRCHSWRSMEDDFCVSFVVLSDKVVKCQVSDSLILLIRCRTSTTTSRCTRRKASNFWNVTATSSAIVAPSNSNTPENSGFYTKKKKNYYQVPPVELDAITDDNVGIFFFFLQTPGQVVHAKEEGRR